MLLQCYCLALDAAAAAADAVLCAPDGAGGAVLLPCSCAVELLMVVLLLLRCCCWLCSLPPCAWCFCSDHTDKVLNGLVELITLQPGIVDWSKVIFHGYITPAA